MEIDLENSTDGAASMKTLLDDFERIEIDKEITERKTSTEEVKSGSAVVVGVTLAISVSKVLGPQVIRAIELWLNRPGNPKIKITRKNEDGTTNETVIEAENMTSGDFAKAVIKLGKN